MDVDWTLYTGVVGYDLLTFGERAAPPLRGRVWAAYDLLALEADEVTEHPLDDDSLAEQAAQRDIIRCIFGNPFRPVAFSPAWRSESAVALARTAYDTRNFTLLPILAGALEEAGCDHADILSHCRDQKAVHARGCWVVDLVLDKS